MEIATDSSELRSKIERKYIGYLVFRNTWFIAAIWLLFYRIFMTDRLVGVLDATAFLAGLLLQIPAGVWADRLGRRKLVRVGIIVGAVGMAVQGAAVNYWHILVGQLLTTASWSLCAGADEALFYDTLKSYKLESSWKPTLSRANQFAIATEIVCFVLGGYMFTVSHRLPFFAWAITSLGSLFFLSGLNDIIVDKNNQYKLQDYFTDLKDGVKQVTHTALRYYIPIVLFMQGLYYTFNFGLLRAVLIDRFKFDAVGAGWLIAAGGVLSLFALNYQKSRFHKNQAEKIAINVIGLTTMLALFFSANITSKIGAVVILVIYINAYLLDPWISDAVNRNVSSQHRATAISAVAFIKSLPYVVLAPLIGSLNHQNKLHYYIYPAVAAGLMAVFFYNLKVKPKNLVQ